MEKQPSYFYQFLEPMSKELALVANELENSIFSSPRTMLTHARIFVENILKQVIRAEKLPDEQWSNIKDRIDILNVNGYIKPDIRDALHYVRQIGNQAAHDTRTFRFSEALLSWESIYKIVKWYVEVYGSLDFTVPSYQDPSPQVKQSFDIVEIQERLKSLEKLLIASTEKQQGKQGEGDAGKSTEGFSPKSEQPGFTPIRKLIYKGKELEVPYFLRDAFLLPQRFAISETFLIRLGAEQQARIMSELPNNLEGLHKHVKRYNEKNDETFFQELKVFFEEEKIRRQLSLERTGELFYFYKADYIIVTEELSQIPLTAAEFTGIPSLLRQLNEDQIETVGQLPKELVILAKYSNVGIGTVQKLFDQLKEKQQSSKVPEPVTSQF
ncbi:DUF4145 domain-containing protein [Bacillus sp. ISL-75]|uniref:DUF4145 domain-containing protein n=1 Tax=Bacillus sp. ISL-75 TaxID=2819137 RepID=UPI001BE88451|nr:DUF4145 domain-containing protein [Bacillus sp. ISL-75]MBT2728598.1 DUF4145 domain-containing protein [Bacillus sp. ISL-75]